MVWSVTSHHQSFHLLHGAAGPPGLLRQGLDVRVQTAALAQGKKVGAQYVVVSQQYANTVTGAIPMTVPVATLVETLSSGNCTLDHLVHVLTAQLATVAAGDLPGRPDRAPISPGFAIPTPG